MRGGGGVPQNGHVLKHCFLPRFLTCFAQTDRHDHDHRHDAANDVTNDADGDTETSTETDTEADGSHSEN